MTNPDDDLAAERLPRAFAGGVLRRLRPSDLRTFQAYRSLPELGRYQGWTPMGDQEASAFLAQMEVAPLFRPGQWVQLAIVEPMGDELVGDIGMHVSADGRLGEVGFTLAPAAQGRGVATAAVREAVGLLFETTRVLGVAAIADSRNVASIRLLERLGFECRDQREALFREERCTELVYLLQRDPLR